MAVDSQAALKVCSKLSNSSKVPIRPHRNGESLEVSLIWVPANKGIIDTEKAGELAKSSHLAQLIPSYKINKALWPELNYKKKTSTVIGLRRTDCRKLVGHSQS